MIWRLVYIWLGVAIPLGLFVAIATSIANDGKPDRDEKAFKDAAHCLIWPIYVAFVPVAVLLVFAVGTALWVKQAWQWLRLRKAGDQP